MWGYTGGTGRDMVASKQPEVPCRNVSAEPQPGSLTGDPSAPASCANQRYRRVQQGPMIEVACAENNGDHFHQDLGPMPRADKPDF